MEDLTRLASLGKPMTRLNDDPILKPSELDTKVSIDTFEHVHGTLAIVRAESGSLHLSPSWAVQTENVFTEICSRTLV